MEWRPIASLDGCAGRLATLGHGVDVWQVVLSAWAPREHDCLSLLDADERQRYHRFHFPIDRRRFAVAHGVVRLILASYCGLGPRQLRFAPGDSGKPHLIAGAAPMLEFNLSHSGDLILLAVSELSPVGVDVEQWSPDLEFGDLARQCFSPWERDVLGALDRAIQPEAFFNCWSRKEAYLKATGAGVTGGLDHFDVSLVPGDAPRLIADRRDPTAAVRWSLEALPLGRGYSGALVSSSQGSSRSRFLFQPPVNPTSMA